MTLENVITTLVLDVIDHDQTQGVVKAIALDSKTRYVQATIVQHGLDYDVDPNAVVTLTILRPDNVGVQITGSVVDVDNADRTSTIKGVYAELTQAALAKSGTLKAQFKITSGEQILRTEIFQIKNGIALDGETSEWADQYEGYNLDELVQSVNEMETDVSDLKEGLTYQENAGFNRTNLFDINGDINRKRDGSEQAVYQNVRNGNAITINVSNSNSYGVGQLLTVDKSGTYTFSMYVDSLGNGESLSVKVCETSTYNTVAQYSAESVRDVTFNADLETGKTYLLGWYVYHGTSPCGGRISQISVYDPSLQSNAELLKVTETINDALKSASKNIIVTNNNSDFGDGGYCVFDVSNYAIKRGYEKDDGSRIFPVPSINAPVSRDIPKREIMSVIKSYVDRSDVLYGDVDVPEGNPKPGNLFSEAVDTDASGNHYMNCTAFVGAIVKGIKYEKSRYVIDKNVDSEYSTYRNMPQSTSEYFTQGWLNIYEMAQYFAEQKQLFYTNSDAVAAVSRLQFGDVLFISTDNQPYNQRFLKLSHCVFVLGVIPNTNAVVVAENTSYGTSFFNESAGHPFINIRNINQQYSVFARPNYNLPYTESSMYQNGNKTSIKPYMIMSATINISGDEDTAQRGYIFAASQGIASCRDYVPVIEGSKLDYVGALLDGGNLHTVRAIFYDENLNYIRHFNLAYGGTASQATVNANEKYVRFMFQVSPSSYAERRPLKINDIYNFTVEVS